jgi:hypothetical protein
MNIAAAIKYPFVPEHAHYEGVRPIHIYLLRLFYTLMFVFVAPDAWTYILAHQGAWDHVRAVAWCVWAAYATLAGLGIFHPLRMLPIFLFMVFYKSLWLFVVAYPLWAAGQLAGSPAEGMANVFMGAPLLVLIVPWGYVWRTFVLGAKPAQA